MSSRTHRPWSRSYYLISSGIIGLNQLFMNSCNKKFPCRYLWSRPVLPLPTPVSATSWPQGQCPHFVFPKGFCRWLPGYIELSGDLWERAVQTHTFSWRPGEHSHACGCEWRSSDWFPAATTLPVSVMLIMLNLINLI